MSAKTYKQYLSKKLSVMKLHTANFTGCSATLFSIYLLFQVFI